MPCNILLIDNQDETTKVVFPHAGNILEITKNNLMSEIAIEVDNLLKTAFKKSAIIVFVFFISSISNFTKHL